MTLIDQNNFHTFQPLLYQVATAGLNAADVAYPIRGILRGAPRTRFLLGTVAEVSVADRTVGLMDGTQVAFDWLVVAAGATTNFFGVPGASDHCFSLYTLEDAALLRNHVLERFEEASQRQAAGAPGVPGALTFVVVGGGATGVEISGALAELVDKVLAKDFPDLDIDSAKVTLVEGQDRLLTAFAASLGRRALDTLRDRRVDVWLDTAVQSVSAVQVRLGDGRVVPTQTVVWAAGVKANPLGALLGTDLGRAGRIRVRSDLRVVGLDRVLAIGDVAAIDIGGRLAPQVAQVAIQSGKHAAATILAVERNEAVTPFVYRDKGSMATIGRDAAVVELPHGIKLHGRLGWIAWLGLHVLTLMGFRNRASVLVNWVWNYLTWDRGPRIILRRSERGTDGSAADGLTELAVEQQGDDGTDD